VRIEILDVRFRNFLSYGNVPTKLILTNGMNLVKGNAQAGTRANRVGKTGLLSSISYALYGKEPRGLTQNEVINWSNKKNCELFINFKKNNTIYSIRRGLKPNFLEVYENEKPLPSLPHITDTQNQIEEILGIGYKVFSNLVFSNLNFSEPILKMKTPSRRKFIEEIFDIEVFSRLNEACVKKLNLISQKIGEAKSEISLKNGLIEEIKNQIKNVKRFDEEEYQELVTKFEKYKIETIYSAIGELEDEIDENQYRKDRVVKMDAKVSSKINYLRNKIKDLTKHIEASNKTKKYKEEREKIEFSVEQLRKVNENDESLIISCKDIISKQRKKKEDCIKKLAGIRSKINEIRNNIDNLSDKNVCPLCQQDLTDNNVKEQLLEKVKELEIDFEKNNKEEEIRNEIKNHENLIKQYREHILSNQKLIARIEKLEASISNTVIDDNVEDKIKRYERAIKKQEICLDGLVLSKDMLETYISNKSIKLKNLRDSIIKYNNIENQIEILKQERKLYYDSKEDIENKQKRILELQREIEEVISNKIEKLESLLTYFTTLKDLCKDDRVKQDAIASIMPLLEEKTNEYLSTVGFEFYVQLDSWLDATFKGPGIPGCSYNALSGGESKSVDVSLQMAFHDICRIKARNLIDIMVLDELLDTSVDAYGMKKIFDIVKNKQEQDDLKVYIISHRDIINEDEFDKVLIVEKYRGFSVVREK